MNREIKFRAWDKKNKEMLSHNALFHLDCSNEYPFLGLLGGHYNHFLDKYHVEIMRYTGLYDKNSKEIYEGDICDGERDTIAQVVWMDTHGWGCKIIKGSTLSMGLTFPLWHWDNCEMNGNRKLTIIGNIYENPELLEAAHDH